MTGGAESRIRVALDQEFPKGIIMGIMAGSTVDTACAICAYVCRNSRGQFRIWQRFIIVEGNRMIIRDVSAQIASATGREFHVHQDSLRRFQDVSQGDCTIVAAQAESGGTGRLLR